jgi:hypothetical protein
MTSTTTRRALLTVAAVVPAIAVLPAAAATSSPDPIFAAIERCRKAYEAHGVAVLALGEFEGTKGFLQNDEHSKLKELGGAGCGASAEAIRNLCLSVPTSAAGMSAVLNYFLVEADEYFLDIEYDGDSTKDAFLRSLRTFAERLAA